MAGCSNGCFPIQRRTSELLEGLPFHLASTQCQKALSCLSSAHTSQKSETSPVLGTTERSGSSCGECKSIYRHDSDEHKTIPPVVRAKGARCGD